jgi:hypothetical protein
MSESGETHKHNTSERRTFLQLTTAAAAAAFGIAGTERKRSSDEVAAPSHMPYVVHTTNEIQKTEHAIQDIERIQKEGTYIDWKSPERCVSPVDTTDKWTSEVEVCTCFSIQGVDKRTGQRISFMTHLMPSIYKISAVIRDLIRARISELVLQAHPATLQMHVFGGRVLSTGALNDINAKYDAESVMQLINTVRAVQSDVSAKTGMTVNTRVLAFPNISENVIAEDFTQATFVQNTGSSLFHDLKNNRYYVERNTSQGPYEIQPVPFDEYQKVLEKKFGAAFSATK